MCACARRRPQRKRSCGRRPGRDGPAGARARCGHGRALRSACATRTGAARSVLRCLSTPLENPLVAVDAGPGIDLEGMKARPAGDGWAAECVAGGWGSAVPWVAWARGDGVFGVLVERVVFYANVPGAVWMRRSRGGRGRKMRDPDTARRRSWMDSQDTPEVVQEFVRGNGVTETGCGSIAGRAAFAAKRRSRAVLLRGRRRRADAAVGGWFRCRVLRQSAGGPCSVRWLGGCGRAQEAGSRSRIPTASGRRGFRRSTTSMNRTRRRSGRGDRSGTRAKRTTTSPTSSGRSQERARPARQRTPAD